MYTIEMILDRLNQTQIANSEILSGDWISSVRFSNGSILRNDILTISPLPNNRTLCRTARGSQFEYHSDTGNTLNQILEVMDYYDAWEAALEQAIHDGSTLTELLDLAYPVIPFLMFILDNAEWIIACSSHLQHFHIQSNQNLTEILNNHSSSTEKIAYFNQEFYHCFQFKEVYKIPGDIFTDNGYAVNLFYDNNFCGILLMEGFDARISQGILDLFYLFSRKIQNMLNNPTNNFTLESKEMSLVHYLDDPNTENLDKLLHDLRIMNWSDSDEKQLICLAPSSDTGLSPNINHAILIFNRLPALKTAEYQNSILLLLNRSLCRQPNEYQQIVDRIRQLSYYAGTSGLFRDILDLPVMLMRARSALRAGSKIPGTINNFNDCFMTYFFSTITNEDRKIFEHPILRQLEEYDNRHGSRLFDTLFLYLKNERRITDTANAMHLSRNTMVHRLNRINELSNGILDDPVTRLRILLSFYLRSGSASGQKSTS